MKKLLLLCLVVLLIVVCYAYRPKQEHIPASISEHYVRMYSNHLGLCKDCPSECGLSDNDFREYVLERIKDTDYTEIWYYYKHTMTGRHCLKEIYVYYRRS